MAIKRSYTEYERFRGRLQLDNKTGSLTITNTRITDSELYTLQIITSNREAIERKYRVIVYGISVLSNISVCDHSTSLSLPLEIQCLDDSYSCVLNNTISNQTTHLDNGQLCHTSPDQRLYLLFLLLILPITMAVICIWKQRKQCINRCRGRDAAIVNEEKEVLETSSEMEIQCFIGPSHSGT
ncbi:hypothetical protein R3I94_017913 [Phoxinus phoxinus]